MKRFIMISFALLLVLALLATACAEDIQSEQVDVPVEEAYASLFSEPVDEFGEIELPVPEADDPSAEPTSSDEVFAVEAAPLDVDNTDAGEQAVMAASNDSSDSLRGVLKKRIGSLTITGFYYADYDGDGVHEAFAYVKTANYEDYSQGDIWFVNGNGAKKLDGGKYYFDEFGAVGKAPNKLFVASEYRTSTSKADVWVVRKGQPNSVNLSISDIYAGDSETPLFCTVDAYDACTDGTGHTWKKYYFYFDGTKLREFGGVYITKNQFLKFKKADEILKKYTPEGSRLVSIIYRGNHIINLNYVEDGSIGFNYFVTVKYNTEAVRFWESGEGQYVVASNPSIAAYPKAVKLPENGSGKCAHKKYSKVEGGYKKYSKLDDNKHSVSVYTPDLSTEPEATYYFVKCNTCGENGFYYKNECDQIVTWESDTEAFLLEFVYICDESEYTEAHTFANGKCSKCGQVKSGAATATTVKLNTDHVSLGEKETFTLIAKVKPTGKAKSLRYKSSNAKVAAVDAKTGKITARAVGKAVVNATIGSKTLATCKVTVKKATKKVTLNKNQVTLARGKTFQLKAALTKGTYTRRLIWTSSNEAVAKVSSKGKVTAVGKGTATITVKTAGGVKTTCKVTVNGPKKRLELSQFFGVKFSKMEKSLGIEAGTSNGKIQLGSLGEPEGPDYVELIEISNDPKGEYMMYGVYLGMKLSEADKLLRSRGWDNPYSDDKYVNDSDGRYKSLTIRTNGNNKISYLFGELYGAGI